VKVADELDAVGEVLAHALGGIRGHEGVGVGVVQGGQVTHDVRAADRAACIQHNKLQHTNYNNC